MKTIGTLAVAILCLANTGSMAKDMPGVEAYRQTLGAAPAPEMPILAARLVKEAGARDREATTVTVIKAALAVNPAAASLVVGAIARAVPEMASVAAETAALEQPKQAGTIAKAASAAAPAKAGRVVSAVCGVVPRQYRSVAVAAAEGAPTAGKDILRSVGAVRPELKPYIEREVAGYGLTVPPVGTTLDLAAMAQAKNAYTTEAGAVAATDPAPASPGGLPAIPPVVTPGHSAPQSNDPGGPIGGRNYARP